jgi:hypothetical protein
LYEINGIRGNGVYIFQVSRKFTEVLKKVLD